MSFIAKDIELNQKLAGKEVKSAASNLTGFAVKFADGTGLLLEATGTPESAEIATRMMPADELPDIGDAICKVEWSWIVSSKIESIQSVKGSFKFNFAPAGPLTVQSQNWQGKLFLSFMPYQGSEKS